MTDRKPPFRLHFFCRAAFALVFTLAGAPSISVRALAQAPSAAPADNGTIPADRLNQGWWAKRHDDTLALVKATPDAQLIFVGDSITQNYEKANPPDEDFKKTWQYYYGDRKAVNLGFSGDTTGNVLWRLDHGEVDGLHPRVAVVLIGTNNTGMGHTAADTRAGIDAVVASLEQKLPQTKILLLGILPTSGSPARNTANEAINAYLAAEYANNASVTYLDIRSTFMKSGALDESLFYDTRFTPPRGALHPDTNGQRMMAEAIEPTLARQLGDTPKPPPPAAPATASVAAPAALKPASNLVVENIPSVPLSVVESAAPYTESRTATFLDWSPKSGITNARPILISTRFGNSSQIHTVAFPGAARQQLTFFADPVFSAQYQPVEGRYILLTKDVGGAEFYQFYRYDVATGETTLVTDGKSRNVDPVFSRDGKLTAFGSTRRNGESVDLWVVDPTNPASARMLVQMTGGGLNVGGWSPDGKTIAIVDELSINESNVYLVDAATGERKQLTPPQSDVKVSWNTPRFSADGKSIFILTDKDSEFHRLCRLSLTGELQSCLTDNIKWDVENYDLSRDGKWVAFDTNEDGVSKLHLRSLADNRDHPTPTLPAGVIGGIRFHENSRDIGISFTSAQQPGDAYSFSVESPNLQRWTTSETGGVSLTAKRPPELIHWKAADGITISGFLYPAAATFTGKRPVIISIHGGPEGQSRPIFNSTDNYFTQKLGIVVIQPNVRGSTGYGKTYTLLDNGIKRQDSIHDIGALLDWIKTRPDLDSDRILITGGSYGGFMTLSIATQYNDRIRASVEIVGMSSLVTFLEHTSGYRRDLRRVEYGDERDPAVRAYMEKTAPMNNAQNITKPMMIVAGFNDPRVPWTESRQIADKLKQQNTPMWFLMANDEGHGFRKKNNRDFQFFATIEFLQKYLLNE